MLKILTLTLIAIVMQGCGAIGNLFGGGEDENLPTSDKFTEPVLECEGTAIPTQFVVRWKDGRVTKFKAKSRKEFFDEVLLKHKDKIDIAEYDFVIKLEDPPVTTSEEEETDEDLNWGVAMTNAETLWNLGEFGQNIVVAVIDSGADLTHEELQDQFFVNVDEVEDNGVDDDGNGLVDDVSGYDFFAKSGTVGDSVGHGSHVSGIIAARHDVGEVLGVSPGVQILPLNFMDAEGAGTLSDAVAAIDYAVSMGSRVINASWGGAPCSTILQDRIEQLASENVLFVAAAGNNGLDIEVFPEFPASFDLAPQITVGASTINDFMASFSNFSRTLVDLVAPGHNIISTVPASDPSSKKSGTSMATPFVSAAAALIWSAVPNATAQQVKQALLESVDDGPFSVETSGRLNIEAALTKLEELTKK